MLSIHIQCYYSSCTVMKICLLLLFLPPFVISLPSLPSHYLNKRIFLSKKSVHDDMVGHHSVTTKKVFITFVQGPYIFKTTHGGFWKSLWQESLPNSSGLSVRATLLIFIYTSLETRMSSQNGLQVFKL